MLGRGADHPALTGMGNVSRQPSSQHPIASSQLPSTPATDPQSVASALRCTAIRRLPEWRCPPPSNSLRATTSARQGASVWLHLAAFGLIGLHAPPTILFKTTSQTGALLKAFCSESGVVAFSTIGSLTGQGRRLILPIIA